MDVHFDQSKLQKISSSMGLPLGDGSSNFSLFNEIREFYSLMHLKIKKNPYFPIFPIDIHDSGTMQRSISKNSV